MINKITVGFVIQTFDEDGRCTKQKFIAIPGLDDIVNEDGETITENVTLEYMAYEMVQPHKG